jgi:hypothetical protein
MTIDEGFDALGFTRDLTQEFQVLVRQPLAGIDTLLQGQEPGEPEFVESFEQDLDDALIMGW